MTNWTEARTGENTAAALLESMRAVEQAMTRSPGLPLEQVVARLQEWQWMATKLAEGVEQGAELAILYEISRVLNSSLDLTETLNVVMDWLIHLTGAERGCLMLLDEEGNLEIQAAQYLDRESVDASDLEVSHTVVQDTVKKGQ